MTSSGLVSLAVEPELYINYEALRAQGDIYWDADLKGWAVLSFEECERIETDEATFARWDRADLVTPEQLEMIHRLAGGPRSMLLVQGEEHFKLHGGVSLALTKQVRALRPEIDRLARRFAARVGESGDFAGDFAARFPTAAITAVLGLSWVDDDEKLELTRRYTTAINNATTTFDRESAEFVEGIAASDALSAMLRPEVEAMVAADGDTLPAAMFRTGSQIWPDWSIDDVVVQSRLLYFAGSSSLTHMLNNMFFVLATSPGLWETLDGNRDRIPTFVDEVLRVIPPVQARGRIATRDVEVAGQLVREGEPIFVINGAANRDPHRFEHPAHIDVFGKAPRHLAFNAGPRACPGTPTTRMEGQAAIVALLDLYAGVRLDPERPEPRFSGRMNWGYSPVFAIFDSKENAR